MNVSPAQPPPPAPVADSSGRVVRVEEGLVVVSSRGRTLRATLGADLLARIAADLDHCPRTGDRVALRTWADGPVTVERIVARAVPDPSRAGDTHDDHPGGH